MRLKTLGAAALSAAFLANTANAEEMESGAKCEPLTFQKIECTQTGWVAHFNSCKTHTRSITVEQPSMIITNTFSTTQLMTFSRNLDQIKNMVTSIKKGALLASYPYVQKNQVIRDMIPALEKAEQYLEGQQYHSCGTAQQILKWD